MLPLTLQTMARNSQSTTNNVPAEGVSAYGDVASLLLRERQFQQALEQQQMLSAVSTANQAPGFPSLFAQPNQGPLAMDDPVRSRLIQLLLLKEQEDAMQRRRYQELLLLQQHAKMQADAEAIDQERMLRGNLCNRFKSLTEDKNIHRQVSPSEQIESCVRASDVETSQTDDEVTLYSEPNVEEPPRKKAKIGPKNSKSSVAESKSKGKASSGKNDDGKPKKKDSKWLATLEKLKEYRKEHGDCIVPRGYSLDPRLASWVAEQRKQYKLLQDGKQSSITTERIALLEELDFAWNAQTAAWSKHMSDLKKFREQNGHCHVPLNHPKFPKLGLWVKEQRRHYTLLKQGKASHMTKERAQELEALDFCFNTHEATWTERFRELCQFKKKYGNTVVPTNYRGNPKLGTWVHHQRRQYKKFKEGKPCHITEERIRALESLDFVWYPRDSSGRSDNSDGSVSSESFSGDESDEQENLNRPLKKRGRISQ